MNPLLNKDRPNPSQENHRRELVQSRQSRQHEKLLDAQRQIQRNARGDDRPQPPRQNKMPPRENPQAGKLSFQRGNDRTRGSQDRDRAGAGSSAARRENQRALSGGEEALFSELLGTASDAPVPVIAPVNSSQFMTGQFFGTASAENASGASSPQTMWRPLEAELGRIIEQQPTGPIAMTLMLPRLGNVDARIQHSAASGWDISLRFSPQAMKAMEGHQERCRQSLRRRMSCRVRLQFEQRESDA